MEESAVEWFAGEIKGGKLITNQKFKELLEQAKEMDKQKIIEHGVKCYVNCCGEPDRIGEKISREIYDKTFK